MLQQKHARIFFALYLFFAALIGPIFAAPAFDQALVGGWRYQASSPIPDGTDVIPHCRVSSNQIICPESDWQNSLYYVVDKKGHALCGNNGNEVVCGGSLEFTNGNYYLHTDSPDNLVLSIQSNGTYAYTGTYQASGSMLTANAQIYSGTLEGENEEGKFQMRSTTSGRVSQGTYDLTGYALQYLKLSTADAYDFARMASEGFADSEGEAKNKGEAYAKSRNWFGLLSYAYAWQQARPQSEEAWREIGLANLYLTRYHNATLVYKHAISLSPNDWRAWLGLGSAYRHTGQADLEVKAMQKEVSLLPTNAGAWRELGTAYDDYFNQEAYYNYQKGNIHAYSNLAYTIPYLQKAETCFQKGLSFKPGDADLRQMLSYIQGKIAAARQAEGSYQSWENWLNTTPEGRAYKARIQAIEAANMRHHDMVCMGALDDPAIICP